jgi:hypothetical protein
VDLHAGAGRQLAALGDPAKLSCASQQKRRSPAAMPGFFMCRLAGSAASKTGSLRDLLKKK